MTLQDIWDKSLQYKFSFAETMTLCKTYPHQLAGIYAAITILLGIQLLRKDGATTRRELVAAGKEVKPSPVEEIIFAYFICLISPVWYPVYFIYKTKGLGFIPFVKMLDKVIDVEGKRL